MERRGNFARRGRSRGRRRGPQFGRSFSNKPKQKKIDPSRQPEKTELQIYKHKEVIMNHIAKYETTIVELSTGSGKSTQIPQYIFESYKNCGIVIAQPLKIGAAEIANRVAEEMGSHIGGLVGTILKNEVIVSEDTRIFFTTTECLLDSMLNDEFDWDFIVIDEVHERSLETDLLLAILKMKMSERHIKLIIMSATIQKILPVYFGTSEPKKINKRRDEINWNDSSDEEEEEAKARFPNENPEMIANTARLFEIEEIYLEKALEIVSSLDPEVYPLVKPLEISDFSSMFAKDADTNPLEIIKILYELAGRLIIAQHLGLYREEEQPYTFLVFLPGAYEINIMNDVLVDLAGDKLAEFEIVQLHANIPEEEYQRIFTEPEEGKRRVILSSNIAESSITLTDVRFIIDFGLNRETPYNNQKNSDSFELVWAAKSMMKQRAGRAGRVANGIVFRLMPVQFFSSMLYEYAKPEIQKSNLDKIILKLKLKNIENIRDLLGNVLEAPDDIEIVKAEKYLVEMGALNYIKNITPLGEIYSDLPFEIKVTRICMIGILFECFHQAMILAALISLDRAPIKSYAGLPGNQSRDHKKTYINRLVFAAMTNSDLLMMLKAYNSWYKEYGKKIKHLIFSQGKRVTVKSRFSEDERLFCDTLSLDPILMRETRGHYCEIKQKFLALGVDKSHYRNSKIAEYDEFKLKLCIAAAFPGKYLISTYDNLLQEKHRKFFGIVKNNDKTSIMIPDVPNSVTIGDIEALIADNKQKPESISIVYSNCVIQYNKSVNPNTLKYVMWLGSYSRRYFNLAWVLHKRVVKDYYGNVMKKEPINITLNDMNRVPIGQRREGSVVDIHSELINNGSIVDEIIFLAKPEYPYKLNFKDIFSLSEVIIEDESVNCHSFTTDPNTSQIYMLVCSEYLSRKNLTIGKNSTLMPFIPLLPQILSLIFTSRIEYIPNTSGNRYKGIKFLNYESVLKFDFSFTAEDARSINNIRRNIAIELGNPDLLSGKVKSGVLQEIKDLLSRKRMLVSFDLPDWREVIDWQYEVLEFEGHDNDVTSIPLLNISEDKYLYYTEEVLQNIREKKKKYVYGLEQTCNLALNNKTELVCIECLESICTPEAIQFVENYEPLFELVPQFGKLDTVDQSPAKNEFVRYIEENYNPDAWEICRNKHVIGWNVDDVTYINQMSPVAFRLPGNNIEKFTKEMWENDFYELKRLSEQAKEQFKKVDIKLECKICQESFKKNHEFFSHLNKEEHKKLVKEFTEDYITNS